MKHYTDREIVEGLLTRNERAVNEVTAQLYHQHQKMITQFVCTNGGTKDDADDLFQDLTLAFLENVWSGDFELREKVKVSTYLYEVARNLWYKKIRSKNSSINREQTYMKNYEANTPDDPNGLQQMVEQEDQKWSLTIFRKLSDEAQQLLRAFYYEKLSLKEIAQRLKYPSDNAAKMHKFRTMKELGKEINQHKAL